MEEGKLILNGEQGFASEGGIRRFAAIMVGRGPRADSPLGKHTENERTGHHWSKKTQRILVGRERKQRNAVAYAGSLLLFRRVASR